MEKAPLAECDECPLRDAPFVHGAGPNKAKLVIVGEAPGRDEVRKGIPFTGKSGRLLDKVLEYHRIDRKEVYVTNAVLCRPEGNRTPTAKELRHCRRRLIQEVNAHSPEAILALGAVASKDLLQTTEGITALRMGGATSQGDLEAPVVATFHPAAALRNPDYFPSIIGDVKKVTRPISIGWEPTKYKVAEEPEHAKILLSAQMAQSDFFTLDVENAPPYHRRRPNWLCIGISHKPGHAIVYGQAAVNDLSFQKLLAAYLADRNTRWGMQNGKHDIQQLWSFAPKARLDEDTLLAHYATDERKGTHALEQLGVEILGAPFWKQEAKRHVGSEEDEKDYVAFLPPDILHRYNATDTDVTHRLFEPLYKEMENDDVVKVYRNLLIPGANALAKMEYQGMKVDIPYLDGIQSEMETRLDALESSLKQWLDNPRSWQQIKASLSQMGYEVPDTTKDTLKKIHGEEFVDKLLDYKAEFKIYSTYVRGLRKHIQDDSRVYPTFLLHGTETGRTSCRRPNMQNVPVDHPVREAYVADNEDYVLVDFDYSQIELRLAAVISGDPFLLEQFHSGKHIHKEVATRLFGPGYTERQYIGAKSVSYGTLYGEEAPHLAARLGATKREAQKLIDDFFKQSPKLLEYRKQIEHDIMTKGYLRSPFGRLRRFWLVTYDNKKEVLKEGYNFPLQSAAGDIKLTALINLTEEFQPAKLDVHDSLAFQVHKDDVEEAIPYISKKMEEANPFDVPIPVDSKYSYRWQIKKQ